jgi:acetylglutamate kinase
MHCFLVHFAFVTTTLTASAFSIKKPNHHHATKTSTQLFERPLTAMYERMDATMTSCNDVIRNIKVQQIDASLDVLNMPVFGSGDHPVYGAAWLVPKNITDYHSARETISTSSTSTSSTTTTTTTAVRSNYFPMASMMQGSAGYIAEHAGSIVVFHLPEEQPDSVLRDIGLCYLLGLKIILVVSTDCCCSSNQKTLRQVQETVGFLRTEVERKLNRYLCMDHLQNNSGNSKRPNVVSGNSFCTGKRFSPDAYLGLANQVSAFKIHQSLGPSNDNILVLTNVILDRTGDDWVCADGCQLAAKVAVELQANKLILFSNTPKLLTFGDAHVQDIPLSMAKAILEAHEDGDDDDNEPEDDQEDQIDEPDEAFWRELHWAAYAVEKGTARAHLVNAPLDGALLEELFTAVNGANTCLYHDDELLVFSNKNSNSSNQNAPAKMYSDAYQEGNDADEADQYYKPRRRAVVGSSTM